MGGRNPLFCAVAAALVLMAGGCAGGGDDEPAAGAPAAAADVRIVQPGAPGRPSREVSAEEAAAAGDIRHTADDVDFMQGMIHHHAQALVMTNLAADRTAGKVALMAERIDAAQSSEMDLMQKWLTARGEAVPSAEDHEREHGPDGELMPGMVGERELARLAASEGKAFDRLFVDYMIRHHRGALTMVADLRSTAGGGAEREIDTFARHVESDQAIEIARLDELGARLPAAPAAGDAGVIEFGGAPPDLCVLP